MSHRAPVVCVLVMVLAWAAGASWAGIPSLDRSTASTVYQGPGTACVFSVPDGSGMAFTEAVLPDETVVDATIYLILRDTEGYPIVNFPFEDIWIEADNGQRGACFGNLNPDANTDMNGRTVWQAPLHVSGWADAGVFVYVNGDRLTGGNQMIPVVYRSADISGDGTVSLADFGHLAVQFGSPGNGSGDLNNDGRVNLSDVCFMGSAANRACP